MQAVALRRCVHEQVCGQSRCHSQPPYRTHSPRPVAPAPPHESIIQQGPFTNPSRLYLALLCQAMPTHYAHQQPHCQPHHNTPFPSPCHTRRGPFTWPSGKHTSMLPCQPAYPAPRACYINISIPNITHQLRSLFAAHNPAHPHPTPPPLLILKSPFPVVRPILDP